MSIPQNWPVSEYNLNYHWLNGTAWSLETSPDQQNLRIIVGEYEMPVSNFLTTIQLFVSENGYRTDVRG